MMSDVRDEVFSFWEAKYGSQDGIWSGHVNAALATVAADLTPGRALDLGCGEGGDALWLAERGWTVTGIDVSPTALARAQAAAERAGLQDVTSWVATDLENWSCSHPADLVSACFLQSPVNLDRIAVLRRAAELVAAGGHLLVVSHAEAPPWAEPGHGLHADFPTPEGEVADLALAPDQWQTVFAEKRARPAFSPDGEPAELVDSVVLLRRR